MRGLVQRPCPARCNLVALAWLFALTVALELSAPATAETADLATARRSVDRLAAAGDWPPRATKPTVDLLAGETRRFVAMSPGKAAARVGDELVPVLTTLHDGLSRRIDAMRAEVLERDGDLEALLATRAYRERETLALTALYYLSWARYQQAQSLPSGSGERRKLLRAAVRGFTEFVYVNVIPELYGDCLYGRGLAFYALGERGNATQDLRAVIELGRKNPSYARARAALDAVRRGKPVTGPKPVDRTTVELERVRTLLGAYGAAPEQPPTDAATAKKRTDSQAEAVALARTLAARGGKPRERVEDLVRGVEPTNGAYINFLLAELATDREDYDAARTHYAAVVAATDADATSYRPRARFGIGVSSYAAGEYERAAGELATVIAEHPDFPDTETALYLRFKAIEAVRTAHAAGADPVPEVANDAASAAALGAYLERFPRGEHASEARYRLAEAHYARGDCDAALQVVAALDAAADAGSASDSAWELWTAFIELQCRADQTRAAWRSGAADAGARYAAAIGVARALVGRARESQDGNAELLAAKASLVSGILAAAAPTPHSEDVVELLADFENRFPNQQDLVGDAIALRAIARARLSDTDAARSDVERLMDLRQDEQLRHIGRALVAEAERREDEAQQLALLSVAESVYAALVRSGSNGTDPGRATAAKTTDLAVLGQIALTLGHLDEAAAAYTRLLELDSESLEAVRGLARTAEAQADATAALAHWQRLQEQSAPGDTLWYEGTLHAALMEERLRRPERACAALRHASTQARLPTTGELGEAYTELEQRVCR